MADPVAAYTSQPTVEDGIKAVAKLERTRMAEKVAALDDGIGWFEWFMPGAATTHIAYVHESGEVYSPEHGWNPEEFVLAKAEERVYRLVRLAAVLETLEGESRAALD